MTATTCLGRPGFVLPDMGSYGFVFFYFNFQPPCRRRGIGHPPAAAAVATAYLLLLCLKLGNFGLMILAVSTEPVRWPLRCNSWFWQIGASRGA